MELSHKEKIRRNGIAKFGSETKWREAQAQNGFKGGQARVKKGMAMLPTERVKELSQMGVKARKK